MKPPPIRDQSESSQISQSQGFFSKLLEADGKGGLISYEEYSPYGNTAFQAGRSAAEVNLKRYRFTGKERDEENGFTYHGARFYAPWLGRWTNSDPIGLGDGLNLYRYCGGNPISVTDENGTNGSSAGPGHGPRD